jgi:pilus assembly protein CpaE
VSDVERSMKRKVDCQLPSDPTSTLLALNFGKPLPEAAPNSSVVKALKPIVALLDTPPDQSSGAKGAAGLLLRFRQGLKKK